MKPSDRELGMGRPISRRDFLNGVGVVAAGPLVPGRVLAEAVAALEGTAGSRAAYPPRLTGMRGSHPGSFEVAHELAREGRSDWGPIGKPDTKLYDLIVVGGGISGLAAAYFYRKQEPDARILILDNHDDFGGHAKRNEFRVGNRTLLGYGGSQSLVDPSKFSPEARGLLEDLKVDADKFYKAYDRDFYRKAGLGPSVFFDKATYGVDRLVECDPKQIGELIPIRRSGVSMADAIPLMPISEDAKRELTYLYTESRDRIPDHSLFKEFSYIRGISYLEFLQKHMGVKNPETIAFLQNIPGDNGGPGIDVLPAIYAFYLGMPGFDATSLGNFSWMFNAIRKFSEAPYIFHFPDGNASIARLLVRELIPGVAPGSTMEDIVLAPFDYSRLDDPKSPTRIRLSSTVVHAAHVGDPGQASAVDITYIQAGRAHRVRAKSCVLACYHSIIPHICPDLPQKQKIALAQMVKTPLIYTNVLLRNWQAWKKLRLAAAYSPGAYHSFAMLDFPVSMGSYKFSSDPDKPILIHLNRAPTVLGLSTADQYRAGRMEMFTTSFETIERQTRTHLAGMLGEGGFDPARDIGAITVNRWPHGYAPWFSEEDYPPGEAPHVLGRQRFGRITIANSDAGANAMIEAAIEQAYRAVEELRD